MLTRNSSFCFKFFSKICGEGNPRIIQEKPSHSHWDIIWCALCSDGVTDPYFLNENAVGKAVTLKSLILIWRAPFANDIIQLLEGTFNSWVITRNSGVLASKITWFYTIGLFFLEITWEVPSEKTRRCKYVIKKVEPQICNNVTCSCNRWLFTKYFSYINLITDTSIIATKLKSYQIIENTV